MQSSQTGSLESRSTNDFTLLKTVPVMIEPFSGKPPRRRGRTWAGCGRAGIRSRELFDRSPKLALNGKMVHSGRRLQAIIAETAKARTSARIALCTKRIRRPLFPFSSSSIFRKEAELTWPLFPLGPLRVQVRKAGTIAWR